MRKTDKENSPTMREILIRQFITMNLDKTTTLGIMSMLETEEKEYRMLKFLKENPEATEQQILKQVTEI